jgi:hypothetical protein
MLRAAHQQMVENDISYDLTPLILQKKNNLGLSLSIINFTNTADDLWQNIRRQRLFWYSNFYFLQKSSMNNFLGKAELF